MNAAAGDRLHFHGRNVGDPAQTSLIVEVRGPNGAPPYLIRHDDGHESVVFPGPDAWVEHK
jgi:Domain of unknown function (DUF1918)